MTTTIANSISNHMDLFKILIIGGGATGTYVANQLVKHYGKKVAVELWDKGRGIGGRMATSRITRDSKLTCDLGAQYFTVTKNYWEEHRSVFEDLLERKLLRPLDTTIDGMRPDEDGTQHFVAPNGSGSIPKYFLSDIVCDVKTKALLQDVSIIHSDSKQPSIVAKGIQGTENKVEIESRPDVLIITMPVPQILNLKGNISEMLKPYQQKLEHVQYSSRYVLGLFYPDISKIDCIDWSAKYIYDNPCIRYVAMDTVKRGADSKDGLSVVVHTSVPFSLKYLENSFEDVQPIVLEHLKEIIPNLPETKDKKFMRWRFSQVHKQYDESPGALEISSQPLVILAGDAFVHSNLSGCLRSGNKTLERIKGYF